MAKRRANGEGSIRKRPDGRWEARYTAGYDPLTYFQRYSDRCPILHLKDCVKEGGHKGFRAVGDGALEFAPIIEAARAAGTPWLCVEQDLPTEGKTAMECARDSITYLKSLL